jgi:hypothetical protein
MIYGCYEKRNMTVSLLFRYPVRNITYLFLDFPSEPIWFQYISVYNNPAINTESQCSVQQLSEICRSWHRIEKTLQNSETQPLVKAVLRKHYGFWMPLPFLEDLIPIDFRVDDKPRAGKDSLAGQESGIRQKKT